MLRSGRAAPAWAGRAGRSGPLRAAALALAAAGADAVVDPHRTHVPLCPFHAVTGLDCPLCGSLRAVDDLARLQVAAAVRDNVLLVAALPALVLFWLVWLRRAGQGRDRPVLPPRAARAAVVAMVCLGGAFTVLRNLPVGVAIRPN